MVMASECQHPSCVTVNAAQSFNIKIYLFSYLSSEYQAKKCFGMYIQYDTYVYANICSVLGTCTTFSATAPLARTKKVAHVSVPRRLKNKYGKVAVA